MTKKSTNILQELPHLLHTRSHAQSNLKGGSDGEVFKKLIVGTGTRIRASNLVLP